MTTIDNKTKRAVLKTDVEQVTGYHGDGTPYVRLVTVTTDWREWADGSPQSEEDWAWWEEYVADVHKQRVIFAQLHPEARSAAQERLVAMDDDMDTHAQNIAAAIKYGREHAHEWTVEHLYRPEKTS